MSTAKGVPPGHKRHAQNLKDSFVPGLKGSFVPGVKPPNQASNSSGNPLVPQMTKLRLQSGPNQELQQSRGRTPVVETRALHRSSQDDDGCKVSSVLGAPTAHFIQESVQQTYIRALERTPPMTPPPLDPHPPLPDQSAPLSKSHNPESREGSPPWEEWLNTSPATPPVRPPTSLGSSRNKNESTGSGVDSDKTRKPNSHKTNTGKRKVDGVKHRCPICSKKFERRDVLTRHIKTYHNEDADLFPCTDCSQTFNRKDVYARHRKQFHGAPEPPARK